MPLSNRIIINLNEITAQIADKKNLTEKDEQAAKIMFSKILERGEQYDVDEVESWFENEGTWNHRPSIVRMTNISHYVQARYEQSPKKLRVISNDDGCGC